MRAVIDRRLIFAEMTGDMLKETDAVAWYSLNTAGYQASTES